MKLLSILLKRFSLLSKLCSNKMCLCFYVAAIFINHIQKLHHPHMNTSSNLLLGLFFLKITYFSPFISSHHLAQKNTIECVGVYVDVIKLSLVNKVLMYYLCCHGYWHLHDTPVTFASSQGFPSRRLDAKLTF